LFVSLWGADLNQIVTRPLPRGCYGPRRYLPPFGCHKAILTMAAHVFDTLCEVPMSILLDRALSRFRRPPEDDERPFARVSAAEFRAAAEQRLRTLEREVAEVKGRINGLIFVVAGAVVTQVVLRLLG